MPPAKKSRPKSQDLWAIGLTIMRCEHKRASQATLSLQFLRFFGAEPTFISILWFLLDRYRCLQDRSDIYSCHLLWTLHFLKVYSTEVVMSKMLECDEKTLRNKVWFVLAAIARLDSLLVRVCVSQAYSVYDLFCSLSF